MTDPMTPEREAVPAFAVVFDRPEPDRTYAWGPFASFDTAARFAEFATAEIDPARVIPWQDAVALLGVRVLDPVTELLTWRTNVASAPAAEPAQPSPEHQAIYLDDYDQVWCDYPTVPSDDQVLPLVWASEVAQSRSDLADGGNRLRVIGWCR